MKNISGMRLMALIILCACLLCACGLFGAKPPLFDGLYLVYDFGGSSVRVTFSAIDADSFNAVLSAGAEEPDSAAAQNGTTVDARLRTTYGTPYDGGILGPLWIPPSQVKKGGSAHGDEVSEVMEWNGWEVGVVRASVARGALSGEWYYDRATGFLVGGMKATIMNADEGGTVFVLDDSNLAALFE